MNDEALRKMFSAQSGFASLPLEAQKRKGEADVGFRTFMNSPMTLAGLVRTALHGKLPRLDVEGNLISDATPAQDAYGQTLGEMIFLHPELDPATKQETLEHEKEHVRQGGKFSALYPIMNLLETAQLALRGKDPYGENRFEKEAEEARKEALKKALSIP